MTLTLEVLPPQSATLGDGGRRTFSVNGGTIGRGSSCDWVLSHRKVSGRHASVSFQDGLFYIVDEQSANGVFINSAKNRLLPGRRYALKNGDRIIIDPYEIEVSISIERAHDVRHPFDDPGDARDRSQAGDDNPFDAVDPFAPPARTPAPMRGSHSTPQPNQVGEVVPLEELDPLKLLEGKPKPPARQAPKARDLDSTSPLGDHYQPPAVLTPPSPPANAIPADYDPLKDDFDEPFEMPAPRRGQQSAPPAEDESTVRPVSPVPPSELRRVPAPPSLIATPTPRLPVAPPPTPEVVHVAGEPASGTLPASSVDVRSDSGLLAVLAGAGLGSAPVTLEFARSVGQIFRVVVSGVMDVLRARQQIKDEFRMRLTQFRPADNNPLKFSAHVDDALHNLFVKRNAAYLEPVEAFEDAFDDLRDHQMAMLAGMRVAFEAMLTQFDANGLQQQFDRQLKRGSLLGVTSRLRYWDLYRERQEAMAKDPEVTFRRLFGEEFAKAYEEQLRRLKAERRAGETEPRPPQA